MDLTIINYMNFCQKLKLNILFYHIRLWWFRSRKVLLWFFWTWGQTDIFLNNQNFPQLLILNAKFSVLEISLCWTLDNFPVGFILKLQAETVLIYRTYTAVKSFGWQPVLFESQVMSGYFIDCLCCQTLKNKAGLPFPQNF